VARDRQRAKQRQAERRARRLEQQGKQPSPPVDEGISQERTPPPVDEGISQERTPPPVDEGMSQEILGIPGIDPGLQVGAPPQNEGRSDTIFEDETPATEDEALQEIEDWEVSEEDHLTQDEIDA
jgi:hypothetical protein